MADLEPSVDVELRWDGVKHAMKLSAYHEVKAVDEGARHLGVGSSLLALVWGRDDGEYFRGTGVALSWGPSSTRRQWFSWSAYAERQESLSKNTDVSLPRAFSSENVFRENIDANAADQLGSKLALRPYWGSEAQGFQTGLELSLRGEVGDYDFGSAEVTLRTAFPLSTGYRVGVEAGGGAVWGEVPVQRLWYLGGAHTLRGYEGSTMSGSTFGRARFELARVFPLASVSMFGDAGWAGESAFTESETLYSVGIGGSVLDGLVRIDLARALRNPTGWRLELYLDGIL